MIISASYRTDIPAFYGQWFLKRLAAGSCRVANPYGGPTTEVPLTGPEVAGYVFWTRNAAPFGTALERLEALGLPFYLHYTVTAYPRQLEPSVVSDRRALEVIEGLVARFGKGCVVWRYDPVFITSLTPPNWHRETFGRLTESMAGLVDEVVLSFAHIYAKTRRNSDRAAMRHGFDWQDPPEAVKQSLLCDLAERALANGIKPSLCAQPDLLHAPLEAARCIDSERLSRCAGRAIDAPIKGNRPGCLCAQSRDIGAYDTCPHGCVYCYAVRSPDLAKQRYADHRPERDSLSPAAGGAVKKAV